MATETFDLVVIGSGPGGYVAAIRAAQLGFKTACIEKDKTLGGTCLNVGCIPSKALLESSEHYSQAKNKFQKHGILVSDLKVDLSQMMKRKNDVVRQLTGGIAMLFKKNGVEWVKGHGKITGRAGDQITIEAKGTEGTRTLSTKRVLIATGSVPIELPFLKFDGQNIISSTEALEMSEIPKHLVVIGGGVIGLEMGSVWSRLGSKVTVVEFNEKILGGGGTDAQAAAELQKALTKQGIEFKLNSKCLGAKVSKPGSVLVEIENRLDQSKTTIECDRVLVSTGRKPYTEGLGLDQVGLTPDKAGRVEIDAHYATKAPGIYAIGDVVTGPMLAHKAEEEGIAAVELMAGQKGHVNYNAIPNVVYTWPELASVGKTEEELKAAGIEFKSGSFPFMANGRAKAMDETEGFVKIIADAKTDRLLGMHIVGPRAGDLIAEGASVIEFGGSAEDIARTCHAHPTLPEVVKEAALAVSKRQIHM
jgi:dihydrolipoamide dehydrogenase